MQQHQLAAAPVAATASAAIQSNSALTVGRKWMDANAVRDARGTMNTLLERSPVEMQVPHGPDPIEPLSAEDLASCLGLGGISDLRTLEVGGTVICISRPDRGIQREYPAFQVWPGIVGEPLTRVVAALTTYERLGSSGAYGFFTSLDDLLGHLTPIEVLTGRLLRPRAIDPAVVGLLEASPDQRLEAVVGAAEAFAACRFA